MSRSGYTDDWNDFASIAWRGAVASAIRGKRGQAFLYEMLQAMAALPERKLISYDLENDGAVCAIGSVGKARGLDMKGIDPEDRETVAKVFGIAPALAAEIVYMNDEGHWGSETPEQRFERMRRWVEENLFEGSALSSTHYRPEFVKEILAADAAPPEGTIKDISGLVPPADRGTAT